MKDDKKKRVILVSIPKSGTYLMFEILRRMGLKESFLHLQYDDRATGVYDLRYAPIKLPQAEKINYFQPMGFAESLALVKSGEFAVGHIPPLPEVKPLLCDDFKIVLLVRDLRDCLISHMRYVIKTGGIAERDHPWCVIADDRERFKQYLLNYAESVGPLVHMKLIACWEYDIRNPYPGMEIFKMRFEDLINADKAITKSVIHSLANFLNLETCHDIDAMLKSVMNADTFTKNSELTVRDKYWSPFAERWFNERIHDLQGHNVNEMIGYF